MFTGIISHEYILKSLKGHVEMKILLNTVAGSFFVLAMHVNAVPYKKGISFPIVFKIVAEDKVMVNGKASTIKNSWQAASEFIDGMGTNYVQVINSDKYPRQAEIIRNNMERVSEISGVKIITVK